jgi:release factor glutamine methyltransferase
VTLAEALRGATEELFRHGVESAPIDAEWLLGKALGLSRTELYAESDRALSKTELEAVRDLVERRGRREPLAYVLGEWGFRRLTLNVDERALVPRPETEVTVERCLALLDGLEAPHVLDVGTGSGAIALALLDEHPGAHVTGLDRSAAALSLAGENAEATGLADRVRFIEGNLVAGLPEGPYELVVSNPPYVLDEEFGVLAPEVTAWEPREAIVDNGQTETVAGDARLVLRPGGFLVLETHWEGARRVAALLEDLSYDDVQVTRDFAGRERVVEGRWRS